jgi:fatty-acyl-CoA synthase
MNVSVGQNKPTETDFVTQLGGASDPELAFTLLSELLDATALVSGERLALVHNDLRLTWKEVADRSRDLAKAMLANGICKGENVALWLPNHPAWLIHWLAAVRIGAVVVPINTRYKPSEAAYILSKSEAVTLVIEKQFGDIDFTESFKAICPDWDGKKSAKMPNLRNVILLDGEEEGMQAFEEFADQAERVSDVDLAVATAKLRTDDIIIIVFTSGTTGYPKGVMHSHNAIRMMKAVTDWMGLGPDDRVLGHLPLFHVAGVFSSFLPAMISGGALVQLDQWEPKKALQLIANEKISVFSGVPTHFIDLLGHPELENFNVSSLRTGWIGGSDIPAEVFSGASNKLGMHALLPVYGMTELTSTTTLGRLNDTLEKRAAGKGVPLGGYDVVVVNPETRQKLPSGTEGEIAVRGYTVMTGYYRDAAATAAVLDEDGWFYSGDLGIFDSSGYLSITGRLSDKFIVGGNNVHPADIEREVIDHPKVKQAYVVARPDARLGQVAVVFVEPVAGVDLTALEIIEYCQSRLASFKVPNDVIFVEAWPITPTGKVQRFKLREIAELTQQKTRKQTEEMKND